MPSPASTTTPVISNCNQPRQFVPAKAPTLSNVRYCIQQQKQNKLIPKNSAWALTWARSSIYRPTSIHLSIPKATGLHSQWLARSSTESPRKGKLLPSRSCSQLQEPTLLGLQYTILARWTFRTWFLPCTPDSLVLSRGSQWVTCNDLPGRIADNWKCIAARISPLYPSSQSAKRADDCH